MRKKFFKLVFIILCIIAVSLPSVGMLFINTDITIGNEEKIVKPEIIDENNDVNINYMKSLGDYYNNNFAFRDKLVTLDGLISAKLFETSNVDTIIVGKNDYLFYEDTLDDYKGISTFSDRQVYNFVYNLSLVRDYVKAKGSKFLFLIPPNKNTLYDDNMPYYEKTIVNQIKNRDLINQALLNSDIEYLNLFDFFNSQDEELYLKHDSHWNNKGALMVYNQIMSSIDFEHELYDDTDYIMKPFNGDLYNMIYPSIVDNEDNQEYNIEYTYQFNKKDATVEDGNIKTVNKNAKNSLLMYRDSFSNSLIPFISNNVSKVHYSKAVPQNIALDTISSFPDAVIIEKVERNLDEIINTPPIINSPKVNIYADYIEEESSSSVNVETLEAYTKYYNVIGEIDPTYITYDTNIYVEINSGNDTVTYQAFNIDEYGFCIYFEKPQNISSLDVKIIVENNDKYVVVYNSNIEI